MKHLLPNLPSLVVSLGIFFLVLGLFSYRVTGIAPEPVTVPGVPLQIVDKGILAPTVSARHIFISDLDSKQVLYSLDADSEIAPASTTKMMTALIAKQVYAWDQELTVKSPFTEGSVLGLRQGERLTAEQLLFALLVHSANDAAEVLAQNYPGGRDGFIAAMNSKAGEYGLLHTHFTNPSGLDADGHYSSASDLSRIGEILMADTELAHIASAENAAIFDKSSFSGRLVQNSNSLLGKVPGVLGIKTGFTDNAGQSLVTLVDRGGHRIVITVLGSTDRQSDTISLINWVYQNFSWQ